MHVDIILTDKAVLEKKEVIKTKLQEGQKDLYHN